MILPEDELDREMQKYGGSSFPMLVRCFEAQWRGLPKDDRLQREVLSERGEPGYELDFTVSMRTVLLWWVEYESGPSLMEPWQTVLMSVKIT